MNSSTSTLNPNAASYVPIFKRLDNEPDLKNLPFTVPLSGAHPSVDDHKLKGQQVDAADGVPSGNSQEADSKIMDEESEMDLAYLQMTFPGLSDQSLADVYNFNSGDLDASVDMLNHLESADNLQDALDIEHPEKPVSSSECPPVKTVNVTGESSSSARPSDLAVAT